MKTKRETTKSNTSSVGGRPQKSERLKPVLMSNQGLARRILELVDWKGRSKQCCRPQASMQFLTLNWSQRTDICCLEYGVSGAERESRQPQDFGRTRCPCSSSRPGSNIPLDIRVDVKCVWSYDFAVKHRHSEKDTASKRIPQP
jgi:hypothetical protein